MRSILPEFEGSTERIKNNSYFSFLALNFLNQRPFRCDIILPVNLANKILTATSLNSFDNDGAQEYGNSIRRHFLNDLLIAYERYSMLMFASHSNGQTRIDPALLDDRSLGAHRFEQLTNVYDRCDSNDIVPVTIRRRSRSTPEYNIRTSCESVSGA